MANICKGFNGIVWAIFAKVDGRCLAANPLPDSGVDPLAYDTFEDATGLVKPGDAYDTKETRYSIMQSDRLQQAILTILFQTINDVRVLKGQSAFTQAQFKNYVKGLIS